MEKISYENGVFTKERSSFDQSGRLSKYFLGRFSARREDLSRFASAIHGAHSPLFGHSMASPLKGRASRVADNRIWGDGFYFFFERDWESQCERALL